MDGARKGDKAAEGGSARAGCETRGEESRMSKREHAPRRPEAAGGTRPPAEPASLHSGRAKQRPNSRRARPAASRRRS